MLRLADGRDRLYQWDADVRLRVNEPEGVQIDEVHFTNTVSASAAVVEVEREEDGAFASVPNILLQHHWDIHAYCVCPNECGGVTRARYTFEVEARQKPDDYVYTETEVKTWEELDARVRKLEEQGGGGGGGGGDVDIPFSDDMPRMNGAGSPGVSEEVARADHEHPADAGKMDSAEKMDAVNVLHTQDEFIMYDEPGKVMARMSWGELRERIRSYVESYAVITRLVDENSECVAVLPELEDDAVLALASDITKALMGYYNKKETYSRDEIDGKGYALRSELPSVPVKSVNGKIGAVELTPDDIGAQPADDYALRSEIPAVPVKSVNGKTGAVQLNATDVGARPNTWTPTYTEVGADKSGAATSAVSAHNVAGDSHNDIRLLIEGLTARLNALADSDDTTLDQMSEIVAYIKSNKALIESITTSKVNVSDIVNNLTTNISDKPLSAAQGVALKARIDGIVIPTIPTKVSAFENDKGYLTSFTESDPTVPAWAKATTKPSYNKSEVGLGNVDNVRQYSSSNPPPYPVTSVNNKTGAVSLKASDVGAAPSDKTITITGVDENGATHTWTVYGVKS